MEGSDCKVLRVLRSLGDGLGDVHAGDGPDDVFGGRCAARVPMGSDIIACVRVLCQALLARRHARGILGGPKVFHAEPPCSSNAIALEAVPRSMAGHP